MPKGGARMRPSLTGTRRPEPAPQGFPLSALSLPLWALSVPQTLSPRGGQGRLQVGIRGRGLVRGWRQGPGDGQLVLGRAASPVHQQVSQGFINLPGPGGRTVAVGVMAWGRGGRGCDSGVHVTQGPLPTPLLFSGWHTILYLPSSLPLWTDSRPPLIPKFIF